MKQLIRSLCVIASLATVSLVSWADSTRYSGQATVVHANLLGTEIALVDTGPLPPEGGAEEESLLSAEVPGLLSAEILHASTIGQENRSDSEASVANLIQAWTVPAQGYWCPYLAPGLPAKRAPGALIGRGRAIELLVNAVLPWTAAVAEARGEPETAARARARFAELPRPGPYGALAFLESNLAAEGKRLPLDAQRQQGLLALYKTECTQGGCGRCALS